MADEGWRRLTGSGRPTGDGGFRIRAYSEFMPPVRLGVRPYGRSVDPHFFDPGDLHGWPVSEYEEHVELQPGLATIAAQVLAALDHLRRGEAAHGVSRARLEGNAFWRPELASSAGSPLVVILPLALTRTQDDRGRVRWTLLGGSELGPAGPFWRGFFTAPGREAPDEVGLAFLRSLLAAAYGESVGGWDDLRRAGFRIRASGADAGAGLPGWADRLAWRPEEPRGGVRYLLTFDAFGVLPDVLRRAFLEGRLQILPHPASLVFWGDPGYRRLAGELPEAAQIPLLQAVRRHEAQHGIRVPQSGWFHEARPDSRPHGREHGPLHDTFTRTHRADRKHRHADPLAEGGREEPIMQVLFGTRPEDLGLYGKPMALNSQIWTEEYRLVLDGPGAGRARVEAALRRIRQGGHFGYRFHYRPMRVGASDVVWHRPLVAHLTADGRPAVMPGGSTGWFAARPDGGGDADVVALWPRLLDRPGHREAVDLFKNPAHEHRTLTRALDLLEASELLGLRPLPRAFARRLFALPRGRSLQGWLRELSGPKGGPGGAGSLALRLADTLEPAAPRGAPRRGEAAAGSLTYRHTARRSFELGYWRHLALLAGGRYVNKSNADCIRDETTWERLRHHHRDLEAVGDHLLAHYRRLAERAGMSRRMLVGDSPFRWDTDFAFDWWGGWAANQSGLAEERNLIVVIPGRDRRSAVLMCDHYDTAYMEDVFDPDGKARGARLAAAGADDNHSATAALMMAAPVFMELSRTGRLGCDVWLVHLTGEEFPSDCLGARHLGQSLVEGTVSLRDGRGRRHDLGGVAVRGVFVLDMIAHRNPALPESFQIAPGTGHLAAGLAWQAHLANEAWNAATRRWNRHPARRGPAARRGRARGGRAPAIAPHPELQGQVRFPRDAQSTLYNTDGQIFSDAGIPAVLFMEEYDINRRGYHDTHDTLENIDLDYGAAIAAIAIEAVARVANLSR